MAPEIPEALARYFALRQWLDANRVQSVVGAMNPRERKLVREAAVMGYVRGAMAGEVAVRNGGGAFSTKIPDGKDILAEVVSACLSMEDLYPTFARMERTALRREAAA